MFERDVRSMHEAYRRSLVKQGIIEITWPYSTARMLDETMREVYAGPLLDSFFGTAPARKPWWSRMFT